MTETAPDPSPPRPRRREDVFVEPAEPGASATYVRGPASRRYLVWYTVAMVAFSTVWGSVTAIVLPNHVQLIEFGQWFTGSLAGVDLQALTTLQQQVAAGEVVPTAAQAEQLEILRGFDASRAQSLAIVTSVGVIITMLAQPIVGVLSDRTRSRWGRRAPWILWGALVGATALVAMRFAPTVAVLAIAYTIAQVVLNVATGPLTTTVADRVSADRRGTVSALSGFGNFFGGILGGILAGALFATIGLDWYFVVAAFVVFGAVVFVLLARDRSSRDLDIPRFDVKEFVVGFTVAVRARDFRWVWIARILLTFGYAASTALTIYMLQSYVRPALTAAEATATAPLLILASVPGTIACVLIFGRVSDRVGRRKPFVIFSSVLMAASMLVPVILPSVTGLFVQVILAGIAFGIYLPVDQALILDVLPDPRSAGRDLGVAALGSNLGQALGPIVAGAVVAVTAGYLGVWIAAFVLVALAAFAILPVKGAR